MFRKLMQSRKLRSRTSWILAVVLVPPFIFFFHLFTSPTQQAGPTGAAGTIFGQPVSWDRYLQHYVAVRRLWEDRLASNGEPVDLPTSLEPLIEQAAWDRLILIEDARRTRLRVTDEQLAAAIRGDPLFQVNGSFLPERYNQYVRAIGLTPRTFEALLRDQLLMQQLINTVRSQVTVSDDEVRQAFLEANEQQEQIAADEAGLSDQEEGLRERLLVEKQETYLSEWLADLRARANLQR